MTPEEQEEYEERAAIIEYLGRQPRAVAEAMALAIIERKRTARAEKELRP